MGANNDRELERSEKITKAENNSFKGGVDKPLIESSFGKPGDTFAASILRASATSVQHFDLAAKDSLDLPSLWSATESSNLFAPRAANGAAEKPKSIMFAEQAETQLNILPGLSLAFPKNEGRELQPDGAELRPGVQAERSQQERSQHERSQHDLLQSQRSQQERSSPDGAELAKYKTDAPKPAELERAKAEVDSPDFRGHGGPASIRNNNPGAMYPGESARKFGSTRTNHIGGGHLIAEFPDAVSGAAAQFDLLNSSHYRNMSVGSAIGKWCGQNDASHYREFLRHAGIDLKASVGEIMQDKDKAIALATTMARVEAGKEFPLSKEQWGAAFDKFKEQPSAPLKPSADARDGGFRPHNGDGGDPSEGGFQRRHHTEHQESVHHHAGRHHLRHPHVAHHHVWHHRHHRRWQ